MTQYKFRGKRKDNGEWITGCLVSISPDETFILIGVTGHIKRDDYECYMVEVIPETVGMYTNHEKGLYVGDIVNYVTGIPKRYVNTVVEFGEYYTYTHFNKEEGDVEQHIGFYINDGENKIPIRSLWIEKIGNIHDNPELNPLEGERSNMNTDPNLQPASEQTSEPTTEQVQAVEQEAQEQAMESAEEGGAEG